MSIIARYRRERGLREAREEREGEGNSSGGVTGDREGATVGGVREEKVRGRSEGGKREERERRDGGGSEDRGG